MFFHCFRMIGYPENHCFSNHSPALQYKNLMNIYNKEITKRYETRDQDVYPKEKKRKRKKIWCRKTFQTGCKRQISNAFSVLSSLHP